MVKLGILLVLIASSNYSIAQSFVKSKISTTNCGGAINIFEDGDFNLHFMGKQGSEGNIDAYPSLLKIDSKNTIWLSFIASGDGDLTFNASIGSGYLQMVVFEEVAGDVCGGIKSGESEIIRLHSGKEDQTVGLNFEIGGGILYSLPMIKGEKIQLLLVTNEKSNEKLNLKWDFIEKEEDLLSEEKIVDRRNDDFAPTFRVRVIDLETNKPLIATLSIEGSSDLAGLYVGSELMFNVERNCNITIKCDVEGYFFSDLEEYISSFDDQELIVFLEKVVEGKTMQIEELEFAPGTSVIVQSSEPKLRRLKDFLALNTDIKIEIQGHVHALGKNTLAGQKISEARAKRVLKYLVANGIEKDRLNAVGFGNTRPVYPQPEFFYEEQANRRVEVLVTK